MAQTSDLLGAASTYYEHRVFMVYFPNDFRDYLGRVVTGERDWMSHPQALDLMAWGTVLTYQARMEPFRFNEALNRYYKGDGNFRERYDAEGTPRWQPVFRLQLTMQLAQEVVINHANTESRIDEYPTQAQLLFDTLHYVTDLHGLEKEDCSISKNNLAAYLRERAENDRGPGLGRDFPSPDRLTLLLRQLRFYLDLLADPVQLRERALNDIDSRQLQLSPQERQLRAQLIRALLRTPVIEYAKPDAPPDKPATNPVISDPPRASSSDEEIKFRFLIDHFGTPPIGPDREDPLRQAPAADAALGAWAAMLDKLFESAAIGQQTAAAAGILDQAPSWMAIHQARDQLSGGAEAVPGTTAPRPEDAEGARRLAAQQLQEALEMLEAWRDAFREGVRSATRAALAVSSGEWPSRRRIALKALGAFCRLDRQERPSKVLDFLEKDLAWPTGLAGAPRGPAAEEGGSSSSFAEQPGSLRAYCENLVKYAAEREIDTASEEWQARWRNFWSLWEFDSRRVALRRQLDASAAGGLLASGQAADATAPSDTALANGLAVLHAARHGGIPVVPSLSGRLSIGQWWRLVTLAVFGDETIPGTAVAEALRALGFRKDFENMPENSLSGFAARPTGNEPVLFILVRSASSPAWSWEPDSRAAAIMPPPPDVRVADGAGIKDLDQVKNEFDELWSHAKSRARGHVVRRFLRWLRLSRRALDLAECTEVGSADDIAPGTPILPDVYYFGYRLVSPDRADYIASPTGVADLWRRIDELRRRRDRAE